MYPFHQLLNIQLNDLMFRRNIHLIWQLNLRIMKASGFIAITTVLFFTGCGNPEGTIKIRGKVLDEDTKVSIPGREIIVQALVKKDSTLVPVYGGQFVTDSSGSFNFTLKKMRDSHTFNFCLVGDSAYAFSTITLGVTELNKYGQFLNLYMSKLTDFKITIERKSKTPAPDTLFLTWESDGINGKVLYPFELVNFGVAPDLAFIWVGGNVKSAIKTKAFADKRTTVWWKLYRDGKRTEVTDTIYCRRNVVNYVNIKY
jgi:hypothetical protein